MCIELDTKHSEYDFLLHASRNYIYEPIATTNTLNYLKDTIVTSTTNRSPDVRDRDVRCHMIVLVMSLI